jgi:hypothetical protein
MNALLTQGVVVMPLPSELAFHTKVSVLITEMKEIIDPVRAYEDLAHPISPEHPCQVVLSGFGATGCPSLTHHPEARVIRKSVYDEILPEYRKLYPGRRLELMPDRFSLRRKGTTVGAESWHRDVGPKSPGDIIYGGWVNLDPPGSVPQYFSCVPGNILPHDVDPMGFAKFPKTEHAELERTCQKIAVPPGHIIMFNQSIAHKISGSTAKFTSYRQYFGWRITDQLEPVYNKKQYTDAQSMPPLPSGQIAPMYAVLHWVNWKPRLREISVLFRPEFIEKTGKKEGVVFRDLPGLVATGLAFPVYTKEETAMFYPVLL